jgi:HD-GYP domain-containing protein (c-di-GMP phosphodiesterase class II)
MISDRPYRRAPGHDFAVGELRRGKGTQFDPDAVDALLSSTGERSGEGAESSRAAASP